MATRFSEARAKHLKEATEMERADVGAREEHVSGVVSLSSEERDMRNAGRRLASEEDDNLDVVGTLKHLMDVIEKGQVNTNELTKRLDEVVADLRAVTDELRWFRRTSGMRGNTLRSRQPSWASARHSTMPRRLPSEASTRRPNRVRRASNTRSSVVESSKKYIDSLTQESRKRIERLALITLPDKLFHGLLWVVVILALFILSHVAWQMVCRTFGHRWFCKLMAGQVIAGRKDREHEEG